MGVGVFGKRFVYVFLAATLTSFQSIEAQSSSQTISASLRDLAARANASYRKGDYDNAIKLYSELIRQQPGLADAYIARGAAYHADRTRDKALADFNRAIELNPKSARAYCDRAELEQQLLQRPDRALADYDEAIRLEPAFQRAYFNRGAYYITRQDYTRAITDFTHAIKLVPNDSAAYAYRAYACRRNGDRARAVADATTAINLKPTGFYLWRPTALQMRARAYRIVGKPELALRDLREAVRLMPNDHVSNDNLAWFLATSPQDRLRNGAEALSTAKRACELSHRKSVGCYDSLAVAYAEAGDFDQAVQYEEQALNDSSLAPKERQEREKRLALFQQGKPFRDQF